MKWEEKSLDEIGFVGRGKSKHRPRDAAHLYGGPYPFIQTGDVKHADLYVTSFTQTYSEAGLAQSKLWPRGTLCITIAANIAETAILDLDACFPDSVIGFIPDETQCDARYIKYKLDTVKRQYQQVAQGAAQDNLSLEKLLAFKLKLPPLPTQREIANILSAYEELIENNQRRMKLLEESARLLYQEWFVRLRFPGSEHNRIVEGVPEGWEKLKVGSLLIPIKRKSKIPKEFYLEEGDIPCVDQSAEFIGGYTNDAEAMMSDPLPLIVFGDHTRSLKFIDFPFASGADGTQLIYPNRQEVSPEYFYFALKAIDLSNYFYARHFKFLKEQEVLIPSVILTTQFTQFAKSTFDQLKNLRTQNQKLKAARDLLLPRLMSGEIPV